MVGIIITTYNRPEYLRECFDSLKRAIIPKDTIIVIIDDNSSDKETVGLLNDFVISDVQVIKIFKQQNEGIKKSLRSAFDYLFLRECDYVMNIDADVIVRNDFIEKIIALQERFPNDIITGFNCLTKNRNGTERHIVIETGNEYNIKKSVGGANMCMNEITYEKYLKPALLKPIGNFDHMACINAGRAVSVVPSVVQHIGLKSSLYHGANGEPHDSADDFKPVALNNVTLIGVDCNHIHELENAIEVSAKHIHWGAIKILSSMDSGSPHLHKIKHLDSKAAYNKFVLKELVGYIDTDYFIICQGDGYVLNWKAWEDEFYKYDYIGAVWNWYRDDYKVGNGGFSFRSKRLHRILQEDENIIPTNDVLIKNFEEDHNICRIYRHYLELKHGIKFAPINIAEKFSIEAFGVKPPQNKYNGSFGFHGWNVDFSTADLDHKPKR